MTVFTTGFASQRISRCPAPPSYPLPDLGRLLDLSVRGLGHMHRGTGLQFVQTVRGVRTNRGSVLEPEGHNLRYSAIAALGLSHLSTVDQQRCLAGTTLSELVSSVVERAIRHEDPGAVALAAWAAAEISGRCEKALFDRWEQLLHTGRPIPTVDMSWAISAAVAARTLGDTSAVLWPALRRLRAAQGDQGVFPHMLPAATLGRWRAHVGCFADQVYPIQALSRVHAAFGDAESLAAADRCAEVICRLQGPAGQWWWHYDARNGSVVEKFPVYSVHQHAMAPMALFELQEAGGRDHTDAIALGLSWLRSHPEVIEEMVSSTHDVIWRKVGRREPPKAARSLAAVSTSLRPGHRLPGVDRILPATKVDYECRPYELGWLLYAWMADDVIGTRLTGAYGDE